MKLHLPKILCMAVMAAMALPAMGEGETPTYINVGQATASNSYTGNNFEYTTTDGILKIGSGDKVGYFLTEGDPDSLVKTFEDAAANGNIGSAKVSNFLTILTADGKPYGDLEISGTGQVYLGGKNGGNFFSGLVANNVTIASDATGTNLWADSTRLKTFTINGGFAYLRTSWAKGNGTWGNDGSSYKSNTISSGLYINGGYLKMGRQADGNTVGAGDRNNTEKHFVNILKGEIKQTGGVAEIHGKTYIGASKVEQTGGQMKLAYDATAGYEFLRFDNSSTTITQNATDASTNMHIEGKIINGKDGKGNMQLNIEQKGVGTISLDNGVMFTTEDASSASNIKQSGNGTINLAGDYSSALFNIDQTASGTVNLASNAEINATSLKQGAKATLNINGALNLSGTDNVVSGAVTLGTAGTLNLTGDLRVESDSTLLFDVAAKDRAAIAIAESGNLTVMASTVSVRMSDTLQSNMKSDAMEALETLDSFTYTIDLISATDINKLNTLSDTLTWKWEGLSQTVALAADTTTTVTSYEYIGSDLVVNQMDDGTYMLQAAIKWKVTEPVPEPATATLGLLALAGLAARRRRASR